MKYIGGTDYVINNSPSSKDINAVYQEKYTISTVLSKFCSLNNLEPNYQIESVGGNRYTGSGRILNELPVQLLGLEHELKYYNEPLY